MNDSNEQWVEGIIEFIIVIVFYLVFSVGSHWSGWF